MGTATSAHTVSAMDIDSRVDAYGWSSISEHLDAYGWAMVGKLLTATNVAELPEVRSRGLDRAADE